ncbi:VPS33 [Candida margitis]|uniref:VPS33 n=1 Tax=Candida margitis TaxID=1775924 RepID=UPI0022279CA2|nr:VPS33 [Candida margitis]KAI5968861.1 VPS33 [Candida margitis]
MTIKTTPIDLNQFNDTTLEHLLAQLNKIYSTSNLLVLDPILSPLINSLTTFSIIKEHGHCQNVAWLNEDLMGLPSSVLSKYSSLIVLLPESEANLTKLEKYIRHMQRENHGLKFNIIIKDLSKSFLYQVNKVFNGIFDFEKILAFSEPLKPISITSKIKVFNWNTEPLYTDGILITEISQYSGLDDYFSRPLKQISHLTNAVLKVLFMGINENNHQHLFKLRNIYGKGNHSDLLIKTLLHAQIPSYLNEHMTPPEIEFYEDKLHSNTDLVVIERNLDIMPVLFSQLTYHGIIDDLFEIKFETIVNLKGDVSKNLSNDELYNQDLKHLNFSAIGSRLNKMAKLIQQKFKDSGNSGDTNIDDMKNLVSNLGSLTLQQDLIKKHTVIGEAVLHKINNEYEKFLTLQNDIFEMDYKLQMSNLRSFINSNYQIEFIWPTILLIGYINDGIPSKDLEKISTDLQDNYGLNAAIAFEKLVDLKLIRVINDSSNDFLTSLGLTNQKKHHSIGPLHEDDSDVAITGGKDVLKSNYTLVNKFWNLHPYEDDDLAETSTTKQDSTNLVQQYPNPSFTLPGNTVPLTFRIIESLYFRDFLKYKPVNNVKSRPNWDNLGLNTMLAGKSVDMNMDNVNDDKSRYLIIVFIGGITRSEMTCLKYLEERLKARGTPKEIIVISNGIINSHNLWSYITD